MFNKFVIIKILSADYEVATSGSNEKLFIKVAFLQNSLTLKYSLNVKTYIKHVSTTSNDCFF